MRKVWMVVAACVLLATGVGSALALSGTNGYEATELFAIADIDADVSEWTGIVRWIGNTPSYPGDALAVDSAGYVYVVVSGYVNVTDTTWYTGVVRSDPDGTNLTGILQEDWTEIGEDWYGQIRNVAVAPVTNGLLTKDDLVLVRDGYDAVAGSGYMEIVVVDPSSPATQTQVHSWTPGGYYGGGLVHLAIDAGSGDIFFLQYLNDNDAHDGSVRRLHWNGTSYDETTVTTADTAMLDLIVGADGYVYSFDANDTSSTKDTIIRIDPSGTDSWTDYAYVSTPVLPHSYYGWAWDTSGTFWVADFEFKRGARKGRITKVRAGTTPSSKDKIATTGTTWIYELTAGPSDALYVGDGDYVVWKLAPGEGGGGKGGGKGKNK